MASKQRSGNSYKTNYKSYKASNTYLKNKRARLEKRVLQNENDIGAIKALELLDKNLKDKGIDGIYTRNRRSKGHVCKPEVLHTVSNKLPERPESVAKQLLNIGVISEQKYKKFTRQSMDKVRRR